MEISFTPIDGLFVLHEKVNYDDRGYFIEKYNELDFNKITGLNIKFVQDNQSRSSKGILRGLHLQKGIYSQTKLIRVIEGSILDVAVDLREKSPTFGMHYSVELTENNNLQFLIPVGFAHGFIVLSEFASVLYKVDKHYHPGNEIGIIYNDPKLNIDWRMSPENIILSDKDRNLGSLDDYLNIYKQL
uniref:dTDP-4-dehydrorhamnose 3,5-epimerase n=1 Tax=Algoriphagus sp. TaxID=1872435 RepID=UPI004048786A